MGKIVEQIDVGDTEWEISNSLEEYKPEVMAKVLDKMVEIIDRLNEQVEDKDDLVEKLGDMHETLRSIDEGVCKLNNK